MSDRSRIHPNYRAMLDERQQPQQMTNAVSETQRQIAEMDPGARWSLHATQGVYDTGGNEGPSPFSVNPDPADEYGG